METKNQPIVVEEENEMQLADMVKLCWGHFLRRWKWFALSVVVCLALGVVFQQSRQRIYQSQAVMLIEDADPSGMAGFNRRNNGAMNALLELNGISAGNNLTNEIFILGSHRLMRNVVDSLGLDVEYSMCRSLHTVSLYKATPFVAEFDVTLPTNVSFEVKVIDENSYELQDLQVYYEGDRDVTEVEGVFAGKFEEQTTTPVGNICLHKQANFAEFMQDAEGNFKARDIMISRGTKYMTTERYRSNISISEFDKKSSLVVLTIKDNNVPRANEILSEIYEAYKRDVVEYKNRVAQNTAQFIDSRIQLIANELHDIEGHYEQFMEKNKFVDLKENASTFLEETSQARKLTLQLETQLAVAGYLSEYMTQQAQNDRTIPVISGLGADGSAITAQINEYNKLVMERMRQAENASPNSPPLERLRPSHRGTPPRNHCQSRQLRAFSRTPVGRRTQKRALNQRTNLEHACSAA